MIKLFKPSRITASVIVALSLGACARFDTRMQANGPFEYDQYTSHAKYTHGGFTNDEARDVYTTPTLTEPQKNIGLLSADVDVRPPTQLIPVIEGVMLEANNSGKTTVLFNAFDQSENMKIKVWKILESYIADNNIEVVAKDSSQSQIKTGVFSQKSSYGKLFHNNVEKESSYRFTLEQAPDGLSVSLTVDALSYSEKNDDKDLKVNLAGRTKKSIELSLVNDLLKHAYNVKEASELQRAGRQPLPIKLGYDDNDQMAWIVDAEFINTWVKLPELLKLLRFEIVEADKNLGYYLVKFKAPNEDYWPENNLNPFELDNDEYYIQLGELDNGSTSISWLDADKNPLENDKVSEIYFSITSKIREVVLSKESQSKFL
ncbi:MAG: outer membrane protein assembly factor BamC [Psychromonas sp.]